MASLTFARPGKVSERQYLGDLACLLDRHRRRSGLALTRDSFAADLAASETFRSALFTLCTAISRMGENDLPPEELLSLVVHALESDDAVDAPPEMRDAFLSGLAAWQNRGLQPLGEWDRWQTLGNDPLSAGRDTVIPFPGRKTESFKIANDARPRANPQVQAEDDRPYGIDALVAAAPAWANAMSPARSAFNEDPFLGRDASLSTARRPPAIAPASLCYDSASADSQPGIQALTSPEISAVPIALSAAALGFLRDESTEEATDPSHFERVQAFLLRLPPRKVFFALAGLTVLAGAFAGVMAYRTLHAGAAPQLKEFAPTVAYAAPVDEVTPEKSAAPSIVLATTAVTAARHLAAPVSREPSNTGSAEMSPPLPQPLNIPAPTMIGYALAMPQPDHRTEQSDGLAGTVSVDIVISRLGDVISANASSGPEQFYAVSVHAVRGWRFRPYLVDGQPVEVATTLQFAF